MRSLATMLIEEVHALSYAADTYRVILRSVTDDEIAESAKLPPSSVRTEIVCVGERAKWYLEHLGGYVTQENRKRD
jgi:hypothetical protein